MPLSQCVWGEKSQKCVPYYFALRSFLCTLPPFSVEPMRTPKRLKIAETRSRLIAVDWESLGYNITRCHTFNVTICYHYMTANNRSKADCLDMDPKGNTYHNYSYGLCSIGVVLIFALLIY